MTTMATIEQRLAALEQATDTAPMLVIFLRSEQDGEPTPEQAAQITFAEKQGRKVLVINITRPKIYPPVSLDCRPSDN